MIACASSDVKVIQGPVGVEYFVGGTSLVTATLPTGADVTFEQDVPSFTNNGSLPVIIKTSGAEITVDADETVVFSVIDSDVNGNQKVNSGQILIITNGATVKGDIKVKGGTLIINQNGIITGDIKVDSGTLRIDISSVGGDIEVKNSNVRIDTTHTGGDVEVKKSRISINDVTIGGDLKIKDSTGSLHNSVIGKDLEIKNSSIDVNDVSFAIREGGRTVSPNENAQNELSSMQKARHDAMMATIQNTR